MELLKFRRGLPNVADDSFRCEREMPIDGVLGRLPRASQTVLMTFSAGDRTRVRVIN
jgi:hypothetical protein